MVFGRIIVYQETLKTQNSEEKDSNSGQEISKGCVFNSRNCKTLKGFQQKLTENSYFKCGVSNHEKKKTESIK